MPPAALSINILFIRHGCCRVTSSTFRPSFNPLLHLDEVQKRIENLPPGKKDDGLDAYGNTWSELDAILACMKDHDKQVFSLPVPAKPMANVPNSESTYTLPRGNKIAQRKLQRKMSDPEMRTNLNGAFINQEEETMWNATTTAAKDLSTSEIYSGATRRDSDASMQGGGSVNLATSLNVSSSFMQYSPQDSVVNKSIERDKAYKTSDEGPSVKRLSDSFSKWKIEENIFDHQIIKRNLLQPGLTVVNPFDPTETTKKVTSNRRRWTHIFPKGGLDSHGLGKMHFIDERVADTREHRAEAGPSRTILNPVAGSELLCAGFDGYNTIHGEPRIRRGKLILVFIAKQLCHV